MSNAGRAPHCQRTARPRLTRSPGLMSTRQEVIPFAALRPAVAGALYTLSDMDRRARQVERMVSRGFTRGAFQTSDPA